MNSKGHYIGAEENNISEFLGRNQSGSEKIRYLRDTINKEIVVNHLNSKESIDINLFNKCTRDFIETEKGRFVHNVRSEVTSFEINHLKNQNILLKQLIAELSQENHMLKDKLFNAGNEKQAK